MTSKHWRTAAGEPGRLTTSAPERVPQTPREIIARGVCPSVPARIASERPGTSRSMTARVASGVLSRVAKPVRPSSPRGLHPHARLSTNSPPRHGRRHNLGRHDFTRRLLNSKQNRPRLVIWRPARSGRSRDGHRPHRRSSARFPSLCSRAQPRHCRAIRGDRARDLGDEADRTSGTTKGAPRFLTPLVSHARRRKFHFSPSKRHTSGTPNAAKIENLSREELVMSTSTSKSGGGSTFKSSFSFPLKCASF